MSEHRQELMQQQLLNPVESSSVSACLPFGLSLALV